MMGRRYCGSSDTPLRLTYFSFSYLLILLLLISHTNISSNKNNNNHEAYYLVQAFSLSSPLVVRSSFFRHRRHPDRLGLPTAPPSANVVVVTAAASSSTAAAAAASASFQPDTSPAIVRLTQWLDEELDDCDGVGATAIGYNNRLRNHHHRRGLFATENYTAGEYILAIPTSACLTIYDRVYDMMAEQQQDNDDDGVVVGSSDDDDREARDIRDGALHLRQLLIQSASSSRQDGYDERKEENFFWQIYLDTLPNESRHFDPTPDFWDDDIIRQLEVPQLVADMLWRKAHEHDQDEQTTPSLAFCTWLVRSRAFTTFQMLGNTARDAEEPKQPHPQQQQQQPPEGDAIAGGGRTLRTRTILIPYLDMLNHASAGASNTVMEKIESPVVNNVDRGGDDEDYIDNDAGSRRHDDPTSYFALVASQDIAAGDELTVTYGSGHETCLDLFTKYGFWLPNNPNDANLECLSLSSSSSSSVSWSTSLAQDEQALAAVMQEQLANDGQDDDGLLSTRHHDRRRQRHRRAMLELRIHLKRLQHQQLQQL